VTTPEHASVIVVTLEDLKESRGIAQERGCEMYANDLGDQITGMEKVLSEFNWFRRHRDVPLPLSRLPGKIRRVFDEARRAQTP
jgi:hypothetical protein